MIMKYLEPTTTQDKKDVVLQTTTLIEAGLTQAEAEATMVTRHRSGDFPSFTAEQIASAVAQVYAYELPRIERERREKSREVVGAKLYDALVALGWTPPA